MEQHTAFQDFEDLYKPPLSCLESIFLNKSRKKWDAKIQDPRSKIEAQGLFHQIKSPGFIAAFYTARHLFGYTLGLRRSLQGSALDVTEAYKHVRVLGKSQRRLLKGIKYVDYTCTYNTCDIMLGINILSPNMLLMQLYRCMLNVGYCLENKNP